MPINKLMSEINYEKQTVRISAEIHSDGANPLFPEGAEFKVEKGAVSIGAAGELLFGVELSYAVPAAEAELLPVPPEEALPETPEPEPPTKEPEVTAKKGRKETIQ